MIIMSPRKCWRGNFSFGSNHHSLRLQTLGKILFGISLPGFKATTKKPMGKYLLIGFAIAIIIFIMLRLMKGGMHH
jgi:hypothetical protein